MADYWPLLPKQSRGPRRKDDRRVLNGIFYILRTGAAAARFAGPAWPKHDGLQPVFPVG